MSGIPRSREGELLKKEKGPLGAKWTRKLVVVDGRKGTVRYHRPTDDKSDVPRKIFHLKSMTLIEDVVGPKKAPHALELRDLKGYSLILACERGAAEKEAWRSLLAPLCAGGTPPVAAARTTSNDWVDPQSKPPEEEEPWPAPQTFDSALAKPFETYEATFLPDQPLGIQLRLEPEVDGKRAILVLEVKDTCPQKGTIQSGDELVGVQNEPPLTPRTTDEFKKCTTELARKPRPLVLVFRREVSETPFDEPDDSPKAPSFDEAPPQHIADEPVRLNATCEQPPSSLTLCLARSDEFSRASVRVEKGSCAGLQVLDDLVALDAEDLTLVDAETALERLTQRLMRGPFPCRVGVLRRPSVFSLEFPDDGRPLGVVLRLITSPTGGASRVLVESIHRDDGPAGELEPRNDELVAIEGEPINRDCGPADFDALLLKLKGASRPLKLTFVRAGSMSQDPRDATIYGRAVIEEPPVSFEEGRAASLSPSAAFGAPVDPIAANDDDGSDWGDPPPSDDDDSSSDEGAAIGVDANIVEVSDDAAAVSDEEPPPPAPPVPVAEAPTPSKLAAFMASTPNPTSPKPQTPSPPPPPQNDSPGEVGRSVIEQVASFGDAPSAALELEAVRAELESSARALARAREERSAAVRELEEVAEDAKVQREKVGKLEQERRASLELQSASVELGKQRDSLQSEVEALRSELKAREEKNRELEASTRARDASLESLRKKLSEAESRTSKAEQAVLDRRASLEVAEDHVRAVAAAAPAVADGRSTSIEAVIADDYVNGDCSGEDLAQLLQNCVSPPPSKVELVTALIKVVPDALSQPFWCDADEAGHALSQATGDWVAVLDTVVEAVSSENFEASLPLLFGEVMKLADEPRKKLSEWRRKAADISTQIKHDKRTMHAEALRRTDAWFDGDSEPSQELEPVLEADHETVESVDDDEESVNETELSVAKDLRRALEVNASLDDRGASLAKKVALIKPRPRGAKVLEALLDQCEPSLIFGDANATWGQPARCGAALEALSEFDPSEQARMCRCLERYCARYKRSDALSATLRKLVDYDVLEDQGVDLWRDRWGDDEIQDEPTTFLPSPRAVLLEQSDEEEEPESPVEERVEARLSPKQSPSSVASPPSPQQSPASASSPQLEEALASARKASQAAAEALDAANSMKDESRTLKAKLERAASSDQLSDLQKETSASTTKASSEAQKAKLQADEASQRAQRAEEAAQRARDEAREARQALAVAVAEADERQRAMEASVEARSALAAKRDAEVEARFERKLAALQALEERLLSAARDEASRVAEEKASIVADERAARVARDAAAEVGERTASIVEDQQKKLQEEVTDASRRVDAKFAELDEKLVEATTPKPFPPRTPVARPPSSSSSSDDACVNLGESLELQAPTKTETPAKLSEVVGLPSRAQSKLRERFLRLLRQPSGPLLDDEGCLVRVRVEHGYEGSKGRCRVEVTNVSDSVLEDLKIDAFADDDEPTLIVSTRLEEEASDLQPGQSLTCRVSCACRAPFVVPPELAVRFESENTRYAYALRLPVAVTCFAQPDGYNARDVGAFRRRWDECGGFDGSEKQVVVAARGAVDVDALDDVRQRIVGGALRGALVRGADPTPATATAASLINTTDDGAVDVLVRLEANAAARAFRVTVRSPSPAAAAAFKNVLQALLTSYFAV
mmetsp:Transcript_21017/g.54778  ORF Transcript_21017/g.54778 Transcript_21017/m.54778 type:complete len:1678 (-) Transcript_21017:42-5075(-)